MNGLRNLILVSTAAMFAAFALPSTAAGPQKTYSATLTPLDAALPAGNPPRLQFNIKNESPPPNNANSNIGSFKVKFYGFTVLPNTPATPMTCDRAICSLVADNTIEVTNISQPIQATESYPITFYVGSCGDGTVVADPTVAKPVPSISVYNGSQLSGNTFALKGNPMAIKASVSCGELACGGGAYSIPEYFVNSGSVGSTSTVSATQGAWDKDGEVCTPNPIYVTNLLGVTSSLPSSTSLHFRWPALITEPGYFAAFSYTVSYPSATPDSVWSVAWKEDDNGQPLFIPAPECLATTTAGATPTITYLPAPYGKLAAFVAPNDKKIEVNTTGAAVVPPDPFEPFPVVIGTEQLLVTKINSSTNSWTVTRKYGNTDADPNGYPINTPVASTPMGLLANVASPYANGTPAQTCISNRANGSATFSDNGDGWVSPR
jgi:hypothetical protein